MPTRRAPVFAVLACACLVAACGGGGAASSGSVAASPLAGIATDEPLDPTGVTPSEPASAGVDVTPSAPGGSAPGGSAGALDVCALLETADIERITGSAVRAATAGPNQGIFPEGCEWTLSGTAGDDKLVLGVLAPDGRAMFDTSFAPFADENGDREIDGVGDAALYQAADSLVFVTGDAMAGIQWVTFPDAPDEKVVELARIASQRLGG